MEVYCCNESTREVWRANRAKVIADIQREHAITRQEADYRLHNATIDNPIKIDLVTIAWEE